jgi:hypothetical protein
MVAWADFLSRILDGKPMKVEKADVTSRRDGAEGKPCLTFSHALHTGYSFLMRFCGFLILKNLIASKGVKEEELMGVEEFCESMMAMTRSS